MNEKNLVICDRELQYANGLGENILERKELALRIHVCTSVEKVLLSMKEREVHILIIDEAFAYEERVKIKAEQIYVLTKENCHDLSEEEKAIYKYQSADKILAEVFEAYYEKTNHNILKNIKKPKQRLIAVYSPIHRIGKTTFAIAMGNALAKKEKTLYLNLEEYPDTQGRFVRSEGRNLGDLLYYMRQEGGNIGLKISMMVGKIEELDYIPPILISTDLKEISLAEWRKLLETILRESIYETLVLDLSESVQGLFEILQMCNEIYMPILEDGISKRKLGQYEEVLHRLNLRNLAEKTHVFVAKEDMEMYAKKIIKEEG